VEQGESGESQCQPDDDSDEIEEGEEQASLRLGIRAQTEGEKYQTVNQESHAGL